MKRPATLLILLSFTAAPLPAQEAPSDASEAVVIRGYARAAALAGPDVFFDEHLRPFYHGVASGDPLPDRVVLWTRVTPEEGQTPPAIDVSWRMSTDVEMEDVVRTGTATADAAADYTVKVDTDGLMPATTYYYQFDALGERSLIGRTRTAPDGPASQLRFAVVNCSDYSAGYFNAYARIAERADLDAVFHLGDYIYESAGAPDVAGRDAEPDHELLELADYRIRHALHKLDPDLRAAHQQHPFIPVWDDHEVANNAWENGAENHDEATEGSWADRKADAIRAYFEWMPIRGQPGEHETVQRKLSYGDLADIFMVDTRLFGRDRQLSPAGGTFGGEIDTTAWLDPNRTILGPEQYAWLMNELAESPSRWKIIGNQVMMVPLSPSPMYADVAQDVADWLAGEFGLPPGFISIPEFTNLDAWDGYPKERDRLLTFIRDSRIQDVVVLTGDIHSSWAADVPALPYDYPPVYAGDSGETAYYDLDTESVNPAASVAVEFVAPSASSTTFGETIAALFRARGLPVTLEQVDYITQELIGGAYPQVQAVDVLQRGYYVLDLIPERAQADFFHVTVGARNEGQTPGFNLFASSGASTLMRADGPAPEKPNPPPLAPEAGEGTDREEDQEQPTSSIRVEGVYPNPTHGLATLHYVLTQPQRVRIRLYDALGRELALILNGFQSHGAYAVHFDGSHLPSGIYFYRFEGDGFSATRTLTVRR